LHKGINNYFLLCFSDYILYIIRHRCVLPNESASGSNAIFHVLGHLFIDIFCCAISGSRGRCGDERTERRVPRAGDVGAFPPLLRILRQLRRNSGLSTMDYVPQLHQIRFRGNRFDHLWLRPRETKVFSGRFKRCICNIDCDRRCWIFLCILGILPLQGSRDDSGRIGHAWRWLHFGYSRSSAHLCRAANCRVSLPALED